MSAAMADCRAPVISELDETLRSLTPQGVTKILKAEYTLMKNGKAAFLRDVWAGRRALYAGRGDLPSSKADSDKRVAWLRRLVRYDQSAAGNDVYSGLYPTPHHITQLPRLSVFLGVHASHAFLMGSSSTSSLRCFWAESAVLSKTKTKTVSFLFLFLDLPGQRDKLHAWFEPPALPRSRGIVCDESAHHAGRTLRGKKSVRIVAEEAF
jgi:hypothetical protein